MTAIETLTREHRLIQATLDRMLVWTEEVGRRDPQHSPRGPNHGVAAAARG